ncbi:hypothetical protein NPIL_401021 [Nephila pilipes]|uniref:Uncharacterized protein n=1 Tax=Nephila pilipes TaxID=299642 RepID=A0A8X6Q4U2_NEPPI|nr:hypothetical protein NPIL_401021 [Nephila pilipes]
MDHDLERKAMWKISELLLHPYEASQGSGLEASVEITVRSTGNRKIRIISISESKKIIINVKALATFGRQIDVDPKTTRPQRQQTEVPMDCIMLWKRVVGLGAPVEVGSQQDNITPPKFFIY